MQESEVQCSHHPDLVVGGKGGDLTGLYIYLYKIMTIPSFPHLFIILHLHKLQLHNQEPVDCSSFCIVLPTYTNNQQGLR